MVEEQVRKGEIELRRLNLEDKWAVARENLIYFVVSGITYAKSKDGSPEEFGTHAGKVAVPFWRTGAGGLKMRTKEEIGEVLAYFVKGVSENYQQFKDLQMEILSQDARAVKVRMKNFGEDVIRGSSESGVTVDEYFRFFEKKWEAIANSLGLEYEQETKGDWTYFTVTKK